jgi:thiamine pyrophosphate-dependent acetolactate synthase large subunit-like protein
VYLSGVARGLLGTSSAVQVRHKRREALKEADVVILAGTPADFRLDYGRHISRKSVYVAAGRDARALHKNRWPQIAAAGDAGAFLVALAQELGARDAPYAPWRETVKKRDAERDAQIEKDAREPGVDGVNPLAFCRALEAAMSDDAVIVADGGDFVATASYIVRPRKPLSWLDPGVFGTLGVGAGFALGAKLLRPARELWVLFGDGAFGWSMAELDTFVRHGVPVIAVIGNDAGWTQIAREQVEMLHDDVGCVLARSDYHKVCEALGGHGLLVESDADSARVLAEAKQLAHSGKPVVVNVHLGKTAFRKGSISI